MSLFDAILAVFFGWSYTVPPTSCPVLFDGSRPSCDDRPIPGDYVS